MPKISIIIPVYNTEQYLRRCVDSVLAQTFTDFECILIDDGSSDNCPAICDEYAEKDCRIRVIHQENQGQAAARNAGIEVAEGKWLLFCDSDDQYNGNELSRFLEVIDLKVQRILYCFNFYDLWPSGIEKKGRYPKGNFVFDGVSERIDFLSSNLAHKAMGFSVCNKLYSRELINQYNIRMLDRHDLENTDDWAEDLAFNIQYCIYVDQIVITEKPVYLITKHGTPEQQNDNCLVGRLDHMLRVFIGIQKTQAYREEIEVNRDYWKIVIWHLRRYFYIELNAKSISELRHECFRSLYRVQLLKWIAETLYHWNSIKKRWDFNMSDDYKFLLQYLMTGNELIYKIKNYWLWVIKPKSQQLLRRKNE